MNTQEVLDIFRKCGALLEGHFKLSSGLHSHTYLQCAKVLQYPVESEKLCKELAAKIKDLKIDVVVGPAMGGVVISYELARQLGVRSIFTERVDGTVQLRRGFEIKKGERYVIAEDVVTTGKSTKEVIDLIQGLGGELAACSCLINRSGGKVDFGVPLASMAEIAVEAFEEKDCPMCAKNMPIVKPGSRKEI
ncbi:orotate phosphoribosyltransferase [Elusimicrobium posterum]|uniref:orotate phosphoribosyltransferase n=1 Tax=Elusimicrobium posterum TaxID=3116653 RepID=UPI003C70B2C3